MEDNTIRLSLLKCKFNEFQTPITEELLDELSDDIVEQLYDALENIPLVKWMVSPDRPRAKDLPHDSEGKIIVDVTKPHILENMDYFRKAAIHFQKHGVYSFLRPNSNPNSEYRKFWDEEIRRCREGMVRKSDGEWISGHMYFYLNYSPIMLNKIQKGSRKALRVEDLPETWEGIYLRFHYLHQAREKGHHAIELARRGAHPYDELVYTPEGKKRWGDIKVGDKLYGTYGNITTVTDIPYDAVTDTYRITLRDGRTIEASDDHKWNVIRKNSKRIQQKTTKELLDCYMLKRPKSGRLPSGLEYQYFIPKNQGVEFKTQEVPVDAYTLGVLLGDGSFRNPGYKNQVMFISHKDDIDTYRRYIPYDMIKRNIDDYTYKICLSTKYLEDLNLWMNKSEDKFIPDIYKYNSREVRLNVLKGLFDTDGYTHGGVPVLCTISERLKDDVLFITRSLGYNANATQQKAGYKKDGIFKECNDVHLITVYAGEEIFNLERKKKKVRYKSFSRKNKTCIVNIEYIGKKQCKCVSVDSKDESYLIGEFVQTHNCSKSFSLASMMAHNLILGENEDVKKRVTTILTAYQKEYLSDKDGTISKFEPMFNHLFEYTPFPHLMLTNSSNQMLWRMGYKDEYGREKGSLNQVMGVSSKDDSDKLRGKRGWIFFEEMGTFPNLLATYDNVRNGVEEGDYVFGIIYLVGTSSEEESDFSAAKTLLYSPEGYNIYALPNVYDLPNHGKKTFGFFFPSYMNRKGCYNENGVSDVVKALIQVFKNRENAKKSADPNSVLRVISEMPITPAEAIIKVKSAYFPVTALTERLSQLDTDPKAFDDVYIGNLVMDNNNGEVKFVPTDDTPIRKYGVPNDTIGALEIFNMPEKNAQGKVYGNRYIIGHDPVDNDEAESSSLSSTIVLDLYTETIVAEFTGRYPFANDNFEMVRKLCLFYNAKCLYEAHPYDQLVRLPDGSTKEWGEINIGDSLLAPDGNTVKVIDIPMDGVDDIYRITLDDGRQVEASSNHIWKVKRLNHKNYEEVHTIDIFNEGVKNKHGQHNFFIPESRAVNYSHKDVPIDPYTMGLLIAEGAFTKFKKDKYQNQNRRAIQVSSSKEDMEFYKTVIPYESKYIGTKGFSYHLYIDNIDTKLQDLGLLFHNSHNKFIPDIYLFNDYNTRLELLKGLMDGDGCAVKNGASVYITTSKQLSEDIKLLCRSLGIKAKNNSSNKGSYRISICSEIPIFKLPRKIVKQHVYKPDSVGSKAKGFLYNNVIINIEYIGKKKCKCVTVDNPDGLYLIGDYVTTHNCNKKGLFAYFQQMNCTHLLADTPEYLRDQQKIKYSAFGSNSKGVNASAGINDFANRLAKDWLNMPVPFTIKEDGEEKIVSMPNLYKLKNRALIEELIAFNPVINVDRVRALGMVMLYREEKMIQYKGNYTEESDVSSDPSYLGNDPFFLDNYDRKFIKQ